MNRKLLRNDQWEGIKDLLPGKKGDPGKTGADNRLLIEAVLWIARTGSPWRDLLPAFGNWHSVYRRHSPWGKKGVWKRLLEQVSDDIDLEQLLLDSTIIGVHQHGAGAKKEGPQAIGRWRGGLTTKIHSAVDANDFIQMIQGMEAMVVIPVRSNRNQQPESDLHWYKDRNLMERFFNRIKQFRRIARRYEKLDRNFMSRLNLVCTIIWLA